MVTRALSVSDRKEKAFGGKLACRDFALEPRKPQQQLSVRARGDKGQLFCLKNYTKQLK